MLFETQKKKEYLFKKAYHKRLKEIIKKY